MDTPSLNPLRRLAARLARLRYAAVYVACLGGFWHVLARFHDPQTGYSSLILFGEHFALRRLPQLADVPLYTYDQDGYDGQFYAQMAVAGNPFDRALARALDSAPYRERRVLLPLAAHLVGLGRPGAIVQIFALSNLICLAVLAALLARWWFPPTDLDSLLRWAGVVFGAGMVVSAARSLTDGPALLLVAIALRQIERGRTWPAAAVLALAGLARETSVLAALAFWPPPAAAPAARRRALWASLACLLPIALWMAILGVRYGGGGGLGNFAIPGSALLAKARELAAWRARGADAAVRDEILIAAGLGVQIAFIAARPRADQPWWRVGAAFAALVAFLGWPVWEGFPSAAARAVLPLTLAFNRLAPRSRRGLALLLAGNLGVLALPDLLDAYAPTEQVIFAGNVRARHGDGWFPPEHKGRQTWRWTSGPATLALSTPDRRPRTVSLDFALRSVTARTVTVRVGTIGSTTSVALLPGHLVSVHLGPFVLPAGATEISFSSTDPTWLEPGAGGRPLAFAVYDFYTTVTPAL